MREGNTDVRISFSTMLDSVSELFNGRLTYTDLMNMDMPMLRSLVKARLENLNKRKTEGNSNFSIDKMMKEYLK